MSKLGRRNERRAPQRQHGVGEGTQLEELGDPADALALDFVLHHRGQHRVVDGKCHSMWDQTTPNALVHILDDEVVDVDAVHDVYGVIIETLDELAANYISHILCVTPRDPHKTGRNSSREVVLIRPFQYMSSCFAYSDGCVATRFI